MGTLRDRMLVDLQLSGAKPSTQRSYLREAENLAKYFHKSPEQLGEDELKAYLLYLMKERHLSEGTFQNGGQVYFVGIYIFAGLLRERGDVI